MRFCSKVDCSCTLASCYNVRYEDGIILVVSNMTSEVYQFTLEEFSSMVDSRNLSLEDNEFSGNVYKKLKEYINRL